MPVITEQEQWVFEKFCGVCGCIHHQKKVTEEQLNQLESHREGESFSHFGDVTTHFFRVTKTCDSRLQDI